MLFLAGSRRDLNGGCESMRIVMRTKGNGEWRPMNSVAFAMETELQELLAESPSLLPLAEEAPGSAPPVVAVREFGLPGSGQSDIIAFSAEGDITIIECKLATNAEAKRKVIGQVLEYAAFLWQMSYEDVDRQVSQRLGQSLAEAVAKAAPGPAWDEETFRQNVNSALLEGAFNLVIAVDGINEELARIIEYVNSRGRAGFALSALEMRLFSTDQVEILVPHLYGVDVQQAEEVSRGHKRWTEDEFLEALRQGLAENTVKTIESLLEWSHQNADRVVHGNGKQTGSATFHYLSNGTTVSVFSLLTDGKLWINFGYLSQAVPDHVEQFRQALTTIDTLKDLPKDLTKFPLRDIATIFPPNSDALQQFKDAVLQLGRAVHADAAAPAVSET
ncbi:MAG: hypothetical protein ABFE08_06810 [Armatimonadia bacterium]